MTRWLQDHQIRPQDGGSATRLNFPGNANVRASRHQGGGTDNGQCSNPGHNDGCHRLYKAAATGLADIPAFVLTAAETLLIRSDAVLGPTRPAPARTPQHGPHDPEGGQPRC